MASISNGRLDHQSRQRCYAKGWQRVIPNRKLSHKLPDFDALKRRHEDVVRKASEQQTMVDGVVAAIATLNPQLSAARTTRDALRQDLGKAEKLNTQRSSAWFDAHRVLDDIQRLGGDWDAWDQAQRQAGEAATQIEPNASSLQRSGIDRPSTGGTHLPAFLLHDSPRESDLGLSVYHRLFQRVATLEGAEHSAFQYIVTTTTQPPPEFQKDPWLRLELHGAPATKRLLRCDLP